MPAGLKRFFHYFTTPAFARLFDTLCLLLFLGCIAWILTAPPLVRSYGLGYAIMSAFFAFETAGDLAASFGKKNIQIGIGAVAIAFSIGGAVVFQITDDWSHYTTYPVVHYLLLTMIIIIALRLIWQFYRIFHPSRLTR
ncbi:hypothetical protein [Schleiferilactobacillus shenzhenensis]|nr:hypothetical protein [Schleiferilactobacillus shenzhenensis]